ASESVGLGVASRVSPQLAARTIAASSSQPRAIRATQALGCVGSAIGTFIQPQQQGVAVCSPDHLVEAGVDQCRAEPRTSQGIHGARLAAQRSWARSTEPRQAY